MFNLFFVLSGIDLTTHDSYFTILATVFTKHTLAVKMYFAINIQWKEYKIMVLKPANKSQIIWQCHNFKNVLIADFQYHPFLCQANFL